MISTGLEHGAFPTRDWLIALQRRFVLSVFAVTDSAGADCRFMFGAGIMSLV
jgi:hypothetical protein